MDLTKPTRTEPGESSTICDAELEGLGLLRDVRLPLQAISSVCRPPYSPTCAEIRIAQDFKLDKKIGSGSFGEIYLATHVNTREEVAVKLEHVKNKHPQLHVENHFYQVMRGGEGIPTVRHYGQQGDYNVLVMELLGASLEDLFNFCNRKFSLKTVLLLADQLICRLEFIHSKNFIHKDMKPENILMGLGEKGNTVHVIDFGLAKKFRTSRDETSHIPYREDIKFAGTARYSSIGTHFGVEPSRRDDMEALGYILIYFLTGSLPWQKIRACSKSMKIELICEKKASVSVADLCVGIPSEFAVYMNYVRKLNFDEKPNYNYMRGLVEKLFLHHGYNYDYVFDWNQAGNFSSQEKD